ncbi:MAG: hypothetical protein KAH99_02995, partial [Verrucomicrobia bacterium]|nr:hypothetical protein [Verrucomicrobiota bacterium]
MKYIHQFEDWLDFPWDSEQLGNPGAGTNNESPFPQGFPSIRPEMASSGFPSGDYLLASATWM